MWWLQSTMECPFKIKIIIQCENVFKWVKHTQRACLSELVINCSCSTVSLCLTADQNNWLVTRLHNSEHRGQACPAPYLYVPPSHALSVFDSPRVLWTKASKTTITLLLKKASARGSSASSKGKKSVFLPPFTPVGNCKTAPGLSPRL